MHIRVLDGKRVCLVGFGIENQATLRAMEKYAEHAAVSIADLNPNIEKPETRNLKLATLQTGLNYLENLNRFDVIIKSPGVPPCGELEAVCDRLTNSTQIFLDTVSDTGSIVIGVTGSKGKSTTASLIYEILKADERDAHLVGNIGTPPLDFLEQAKEGTIFVQEMSSYQLMDLTASPPVAIVTSLFPEHLDYHGTFENYVDAKQHIARFQSNDDTIFYAKIPKETKRIADASPGTKMGFDANDAPVTLERTHFIGTHNLRNIAGAWKVAEHLGVDRAIAVRTIESFKPLPHRLQSLGIHHGIHWVDDAISTTPESTIAALDALGDAVTTIILGGKDRGVDYANLGKRIAASNARTVILFPGSGPRIRRAIEAAGATVQFFDASSMEAAVSIAEKQTNPNPPNQSPFGGAQGGAQGDSSGQAESRTRTRIPNPIVLLSPASPSYGMFRNFEEKGEAFRNEATNQSLRDGSGQAMKQ